MSVAGRRQREATIGAGTEGGGEGSRGNGSVSECVYWSGRMYACASAAWEGKSYGRGDRRGTSKSRSTGGGAQHRQRAERGSGGGDGTCPPLR